MPSLSRRSRVRIAGAVAVAASGVVTVAMLVPSGSALASGLDHDNGNKFHQTNLISDRSDQGAQVVDGNLQNPWGLAFGPTPVWVANNNSGTATVYPITPPTATQGPTTTPAVLTVGVPGGRPSTNDGPSPTGQVFNGGTGFVVTTKMGTGPARFIFSSESGQITAWSPAANGTVKSVASLEFSSPTAVYKGLAIAATLQGTFLYASNFHDGTIDVFDSSFQPAHLTGDFKDPFLPDGYAPFDIQNLDGLLYVTYAKQAPGAHDDVGGQGHGFVDIFTTDGILIERLISHGVLDSPWGLAVAPAGFGRFGGALLVGNFRDGLIHAYNRFTGELLGTLRHEDGDPIFIDHLWSLQFGTGNNSGGPNTLLFSAGINDEKDGLVGAINAVP